MSQPAGMSVRFQYASFLIRLWRSAYREEGVDPGWHSEVEHIQSGETWSFSTIEELEAFFRQQATQPQGLEWIELKEVE
jgi:hypothetical protein